MKNITITNINGSDQYLVKNITETEATQSGISDVKGFALLREIPKEPGVYQGEVYESGDELLDFGRFKLSFTQRYLSDLELSLSKDDSTYFRANSEINSTPTDFRILWEDFQPSDSIFFKLSEAVLFDIYESQIAYDFFVDVDGEPFIDADDSEFVNL
jgi:hypothetical protein